MQESEDGKVTGEPIPFVGWVKDEDPIEIANKLDELFKDKLMKREEFEVLATASAMLRKASEK